MKFFNKWFHFIAFFPLHPCDSSLADKLNFSGKNIKGFQFNYFQLIFTKSIFFRLIFPTVLSIITDGDAARIQEGNYSCKSQQQK